VPPARLAAHLLNPSLVARRPGDQVYEGQVVGMYNKAGDLKINVCKQKALTNMRAANKEVRNSCCGGQPAVLSCQLERCPGRCTAGPALARGARAAPPAARRRGRLTRSPRLPRLHLQVKTVLDEPRIMGMDDALEYINDDELVEVTPKSIRVRKDPQQANKRKK
jgi:hypothetical protein